MHTQGRQTHIAGLCVSTFTDPFGLSALWIPLPIVLQPFTGSLFLLQREITNTILELHREWWTDAFCSASCPSCYNLCYGNEPSEFHSLNILSTPFVYCVPKFGWVYGLLCCSWIKTASKVDPLRMTKNSKRKCMAFWCFWRVQTTIYNNS